MFSLKEYKMLFYKWGWMLFCIPLPFSPSMSSTCSPLTQSLSPVWSCRWVIWWGMASGSWSVFPSGAGCRTRPEPPPFPWRAALLLRRSPLNWAWGSAKKGQEVKESLEGLWLAASLPASAAGKAEDEGGVGSKLERGEYLLLRQRVNIRVRDYVLWTRKGLWFNIRSHGISGDESVPGPAIA